MSVSCLTDLADVLAADSVDDIQRQVYKYTACGGSLSFLVKMENDPDEIEYWYHEKPSALPVGHRVIGVKFTSIVEGADATFDGDALLFPFTEEAYRAQEKEMEKFCESAWREANEDEE